MSTNDPYYLNLLVMLGILLLGAAAGYYTARLNGQQAVLKLKNELINDLSQKVEQLEKKVKQLEEDKEKLQSTIDDLVALEDARKRVAQRNHRASAPSPARSDKNGSAESEQIS